MRLQAVGWQGFDCAEPKPQKPDPPQPRAPPHHPTPRTQTPPAHRAGSRFNHACRPNAAFHPAPGGKLAVRLVTDASPGDEVTICYSDLLAAPLEERREDLRARYGFECRCPRCEEDEASAAAAAAAAAAAVAAAVGPSDAAAAAAAAEAGEEAALLARAAGAVAAAGRRFFCAVRAARGARPPLERVTGACRLARGPGDSRVGSARGMLSSRRKRSTRACARA